MKICGLILVLCFAYIEAQTAAPVDYRELYDHLLMESINEKIREGERFLERLTTQLHQFQRTHDEEVHKQIIRELNWVMPMLDEFGHHFEAELKKTGLDLLERFIIEKAKNEHDLLVKAFAVIHDAVKVTTGPTTKAPIFLVFAETAAPTQAPTDWRQAYDQLLFAFIEEHIRRADGDLLRIQRELKEYQTTKDKAVKDRIVAQVESELALLKATEEHAARELKRTDLNHIERFLYEKSYDQTGLLIKHFTQIEADLKKEAFL